MFGLKKRKKKHTKRQDQKTLITAPVQFLTAFTEVIFLEERLGTRPCLFLLLKFS